MKGTDLVAWRKRNGYPTQDALRRELELGSRGTISNWENSVDELPRVVFLALMALEKDIGARNIFGFEKKQNK